MTVPLNLKSFVNKPQGELLRLKEKTLETVRMLKITQIQWNDFASIGFTLSDGSFCKAGNKEFNQSHTFSAGDRITSVSVVMARYDRDIFQINFYCGNYKIVQIGKPDD